MSLQTKYIAGISLGVMGVGFAASIPFQGTIAGEIIQGGFDSWVSWRACRLVRSYSIIPSPDGNTNSAYSFVT